MNKDNVIKYSHDKKISEDAKQKFLKNGKDTVYIVKINDDWSCTFKQWKYANIDSKKEYQKIDISFIPKGLYEGELVYFDDEFLHVDDRQIVSLTKECNKNFQKLKDAGWKKNSKSEEMRELYAQRDRLIELMSSPIYLNKEDNERYVQEKRKNLQKEYTETSKKKTRLKHYLKQF